MTTFQHEQLNYKLKVFRQSDVLSVIICLILSYSLYWENNKFWSSSLVLLVACFIYLSIFLMSFKVVDKERLYLITCWITLGLMGYFLTAFPFVDSPALPWLCILPSLLIFFLNGISLLFSVVIVVLYFVALIYPNVFMPQQQILVSQKHTLVLMISSICALGYAFFISFALWNVNNKQKKYLFEQNKRDPLTGVFNRRAMQEVIERRKCFFIKPHSIGVIMVDIDNFKAINDNYGHCVGDSVLKMVCESIRANLREPDVIARYGGEEFVILVDKVELPELQAIVARILESVRKNYLTHNKDQIYVTISGGCVFMIDGDYSLIPKAIAIADEKLYEAKQNGKDQIISAAL